MIKLSKISRLVLLAVSSTGATYSFGALAATQANEMSVTYSLYGGQQEKVSYSTSDIKAPYRDYTQKTTLDLRDDVPKVESYKELPGYPKVRSGNLSFDALFALSLEEMRRDSVQNIKDWSYNSGQNIPCDCFQTGEKWHYVWTRDLSYAADLSFSMTDPQRVVNSLLFKLSGYRDGVTKPAQVPGSADGLQVVQDTGSGGSWPISTDRMSWSIAASSVLPNLQPEQRAEFVKKAYPGLVNTIEIDRVAAFDAEDGLYAGEQSFLDWREQTYAFWVALDLSSLATSKSLSTNAGHYNALKLTAELAKEAGDTERAKKYAGWAKDLKQRVNERFWLEEQQQYSSIIASHFDGAPMKKYDWLGISLAVLTGLIDGERAEKAVANYPHGPMGAPVIFPMQQGVSIYHNRGIWPFVTAYGMNAAKAVKNSRVADAGYETLVRSAALNLSSMENYEWLSNEAIFKDPKNSALNGPVINSKRQLWSVAGYVNLVVKSLFGIEVEGERLVLNPFVTAGIKEREFAGQQQIELNDLTIKGKKLNVKLHFPKTAAKQGYYPVAKVKINGKKSGSSVLMSELADTNQIDIFFDKAVDDGQGITRVEGSPYATDDPALFGPYAPVVERVTQKGSKAKLVIQDPQNSGKISYNIFKDGQLIGSTTDKSFSFKADGQTEKACFSVEAVYTQSGNHSHHSQPYCMGMADPIYIEATDIAGKKLTHRFIKDWGSPNQKPVMSQFEVSDKGRYALQFQYKNHHHRMNLGITNGMKMVSVLDKSGKVVAQGTVQAPHTPQGEDIVHAEPGLGAVTGNPYRLSTPLMLDLKPGQYQLKVEDFLNMSYLSSNETFNGGGGLEGAVNSFDLRGIRLMPINKF